MRKETSCGFSPAAVEATAPPLERDPRRVLADVLDGKVSAAAACSVYGVVLDLAVQAVDEEATKGVAGAFAWGE